MRWGNTIKLHNDGIWEGFLFIPRCIAGEWRWLEKAKIGRVWNEGKGRWINLYWA